LAIIKPIEMSQKTLGQCTDIQLFQANIRNAPISVVSEKTKN
jgi:hypothetical protein